MECTLVSLYKHRVGVRVDLKSIGFKKNIIQLFNILKFTVILVSFCLLYAAYEIHINQPLNCRVVTSVLTAMP